MSIKLPLGEDVLLAVDGFSIPPAGGRAFNVGSMPFLFQDSYGVYHGATRNAQAQTFLINVLKWLRGTRSNGVVSVSPEAQDYSWYADGEDGLVVGLDARSAIETAGFTIREYGPEKTADNLFSGTDVVIFDGWLQNPSTGSPAGGISADETAGIWDYVVNQGKAILYLSPANSAGGFGWGVGAAYSYQVGFFTLYGYAGSEQLFGDTFDGGQTFGVKLWGGKQTQGGGTTGTPVEGETYPSAKVASWKNATNASHWFVFGAFSNHEDIGGVGDSWT